MRCHDVKRIQLAKERDQWWTLMNMVVNLQCMLQVGNCMPY